MAWSRVLAFNDPFACQAALQSVAQAEILPTARGSFHVTMTQIGMNKLRMQRFNGVLPQISTVAIASDRRLFGFLIEPSSSNPRHSGIEVTPNDIFVYAHDVLHQRSASEYHVGTMSVPATDFPLLCKTVIGSEFLEEPHNSVVRPAPALLARLRTLHKIVGQLADDTPDLLELPEVCRALEEQLLHVMIRCLAEGAGVDPTLAGRRYHATMVRLEEFLEANPDRPLYLTEICAALGVAERTLRHACEEHLGMGPIRFLTLRRMHLVRQALLRAAPSKATVTSIVTDHGFWELGRFSVAYRALFGETPMMTLRRTADLAPISLNRPSSLAATGLSGRVN
jgi:AraC-like DNA-binding protein